VDGLWIDADGKRGAVFRVLGAQADWAHNLGLHLVERTSGGFFLRIDNEWVAEIPALSTAVLPAPDWLRNRPATTLHVVVGGSGYAVLPLPSHVADCSQAVEIVSSSGESCGAVVFAAGSGACEMKEITVGDDGTVVQQLPDSRERDCSGIACSCTWQWWPAFFR
jgi:hypothetical protein